MFFLFSMVLSVSERLTYNQNSRSYRDAWLTVSLLDPCLIYALVLLSPAALKNGNHRISTLCASPRDRHLRDIARHLTMLCLGTSHLYYYIARHYETPRRLYPCPTQETFTRHSVFSPCGLRLTPLLFYRLSYRGLQ